jgi:Spy/CpxP family protein refolding chaperone
VAKIIVILGFCLAFAAGLVIGTRSHPAKLSPAAPGSTPTTGPSARHGSWLSSELGLTSDQREKLDKIWSETARNGREERDERRREYRRDRDTAIAELVPPARMGEYDKIIETYSDRVASLDRESRESYEAAVDKTKQILTPDQRARYEELLKQHKWGPPRGHRNETTTTRPTSTSPSGTSRGISKGAES